MVELFELLHLFMVGLGHYGSLATVLPLQSSYALLHDILSYYFDAVFGVLSLLEFMVSGRSILLSHQTETVLEVTYALVAALSFFDYLLRLRSIDLCFLVLFFLLSECRPSLTAVSGSLFPLGGRISCS